MIKEFQRLKEDGQSQFGWDVRRELTKINYRLHTNAIKENLILVELTKNQVGLVYATKVGLLNVTLFGKTAKQWREDYPDTGGNIRDQAGVQRSLFALRPKSRQPFDASPKHHLVSIQVTRHPVVAMRHLFDEVPRLFSTSRGST